MSCNFAVAANHECEEPLILDAKIPTFSVKFRKRLPFERQICDNSATYRLIRFKSNEFAQKGGTCSAFHLAWKRPSKAQKKLRPIELREVLPFSSGTGNGFPSVSIFRCNENR